MNRQKAAIIGCGFVGSSTAFALMQKGLFSELVLIDADQKKAHGEAADIAHGRPFAHMMQIYAGDYADVGDCGLIIVTAGAAQKPGESRMALVHKNVEILKTIIPQITAQNFEGILLIVSNPVDILTYAAWKISGYPKERVIGSGTVLDSARFRYLLSEHLQVDSASVHAMIIGEHGDSELAVWSGANAVSYTHLDVYKRQDDTDRAGGTAGFGVVCFSGGEKIPEAFHYTAGVPGTYQWTGRRKLWWSSDHQSLQQRR